MTLDADTRRFRRLNTPVKLNTALRTALNGLIGAEQRRAQDPSLFQARRAWAERLLDAGACPTQATVPSGLTLLHWAVQSGSPEMARLLIRHGADPHRKDLQGMPASPVDKAQETVTRSGGARGQALLTVLVEEAPRLLEARALRQALAEQKHDDPVKSVARPRPRL